MTPKNWRIEPVVFVVAFALAMCAIPATGGEIATQGYFDDDGVWQPTDGPLSDLDTSFLTLMNGQSVIVKFDSPVALVAGSFSLRIHMDGTSTGIENTQLWLSASPPSFTSFLPDSTFIGSYYLQVDPPLVPPDGLTADWFQFSVDAAGFDFSTFQYVKIQAPSGASISIDAVEAPEFTTLPDDPIPDDPILMVEQLITKVADFNFDQGINNSLDAKLEAARKALADVKTNNDASAICKLEAFINEVEAQRDNKLESWQADMLIFGVHHTPADPTVDFAGAQDIIDVLSES